MSSRLFHSISLVAGLTVLSTSVARAQDRAVIVAARAGGLSALRDLNEAGSVDFKTGMALGGSVGVQLQRYIVVEADITDVVYTGGVSYRLPF